MLEPFHCGPAFTGHPFSRSYGVILPSSLTMLLPSALGFSPHPPVSVYGTGTIRTIAAFLDAWLTYFPTRFRSASRLRIALRFFLQDSYLACTRLSIPRLCSPHVSPQFCLLKVQEFQPVVHRLRFSPRLRSRLTLSRRSLLRNPRAFGGKDSHLSFRYSYRHSHFLFVHMSFRSCFFLIRTLPYP